LDKPCEVKQPSSDWRRVLQSWGRPTGFVFDRDLEDIQPLNRLSAPYTCQHSYIHDKRCKTVAKSPSTQRDNHHHATATATMPKFFCDYCDVYLTHDSMSVRKAHNSGRNHLRNVVDYYQQIGHEKAQSVIDSITNSYAAEGQSANNPMLNTAPPGFGPPGFPAGMPPGMPAGFPMPPGGLPPGFPAGV
jgi:hypothetical protein